MDLSIPGSDFQSSLFTSLTAVFGDNVQDLLGVGALHHYPSSIFTVNSIADVVDDHDGVTTLREAINWANADEMSDLIVFERSLFSNEQTITLSLGQLGITNNLSIIAPRDEFTGGNLLTVSGNRGSGLFEDIGNRDSRVFEIATGATVSIDGLIIANGNGNGTGDNGGGIKNSGTLTLDNSIVRNNSARDLAEINSTTGRLVISGGNGGGIDNSGTLTVNNSTISGNEAGRSGSGINNSGTLTVNNSTISGNEADRSGGGIDNSGTLTVNNSTISGNEAIFGGGIGNSGTLTVNNSTITRNSASPSSFFFPFFPFGGGGIYNAGTLTVNNSTITHNSTVASLPFFLGNGGGIYNAGILTLVFSTLTLNQAVNGSGVFNNASGLTSVRNTIIAANLNTTNGINPDVSGTFSSNGYNLIGEATGSTGFGVTGDIVGDSDNPINPLLALLDFNGGSTQTIALLPDSPAIDAGDPTVLDTDPIIDQRGFPRVINGRADIGAFEFS